MSGRPLELSAPEVRVLGCLLEKQRTTPDGYPLTLNSLRLACNQSTGREPVVDYDDATVRAAAERLARHRLARFASGAGSRAAKYRHLLDEALGLGGPELALLCLLMLRGPQTPGELKARGERLRGFAGLEEVHDTLAGLIERGLAVRLERRPGQKEERYAHLLGEQVEPPEPVSSSAAPAGSLEERVARLEREVAELREAIGE
jgi:uncharacterized protein YceH (UPF0502 family)